LAAVALISAELNEATHASLTPLTSNCGKLHESTLALGVREVNETTGALKIEPGSAAASKGSRSKLRRASKHNCRFIHHALREFGSSSS
jgi:hypothetical protein